MSHRKVGDGKMSALLRRKDTALLMEERGQGLFCNTVQNTEVWDQQCKT